MLFSVDFFARSPIPQGVGTPNGSYESFLRSRRRSFPSNGRLSDLSSTIGPLLTTFGGVAPISRFVQYLTVGIERPFAGRCCSHKHTPTEPDSERPSRTTEPLTSSSSVVMSDHQTVLPDFPPFRPAWRRWRSGLFATLLCASFGLSAATTDQASEPAVADASSNSPKTVRLGVLNRLSPDFRSSTRTVRRFINPTRPTSSRRRSVSKRATPGRPTRGRPSPKR